MQLLTDLNLTGATIILVTHDADVAAYSRRVIHLRDGLITRDEPVTRRPTSAPGARHPGADGVKLTEGIREAFDTVRHNKLRTGLTILSLVIGVSSVIAVMAIGTMGRRAGDGRRRRARRRPVLDRARTQRELVGARRAASTVPARLPRRGHPRAGARHKLAHPGAARRRCGRLPQYRRERTALRGGPGVRRDLVPAAAGRPLSGRGRRAGEAARDRPGQPHRQRAVRQPPGGGGRHGAGRQAPPSGRRRAGRARAAAPPATVQTTRPRTCRTTSTAPSTTGETSARTSPR